MMLTEVKTKQCPRCAKSLPRTVEFFGKGQSNIRPACTPCNARKGARTHKEVVR